MLDQLRRDTPPHVLDIVDRVWGQKDLFVCWPREALLFMPGVVRRVGFQYYTDEQNQRLHEAGITPDRRNNGPAIMAYRLAGGERPGRVAPGRGWSVHHIYDGKFPAPGAIDTTHAVRDERYFTEAAGMVAIHRSVMRSRTRFRISRGFFAANRVGHGRYCEQ